MKKSRSEAIWQRFRGACDRFFARYAQRHDVARGERVAAREAICRRARSARRVRRRPTRAATGRPARATGARAARRSGSRRSPRAASTASARAALDERFADGVRSGHRALARRRSPAPISIPTRTASRWKRSCSAMEDLATRSAGRLGGGDAALSPTTRLAAMLKEALAANTIGGKVDDDSRLPRRAGRRAPGAGELVAHRPGAGGGAARARRSLPARDPPDHGARARAGRAGRRWKAGRIGQAGRQATHGRTDATCRAWLDYADLAATALPPTGS